MAREEILAFIEKYNLTVSSEFIPSSYKNGTKLSDMKMTYRITLKKGDLNVLDTKYHMGVGHCRSYPKNGNATSVSSYKAIINELRTGRCFPHKPVQVDVADVVYSLASDSQAIDYATYEDWAATCGYDPDSRKGERVYRQCLEHGLKIRSALGEAGLAELHEAIQDY